MSCDSYGHSSFIITQGYVPVEIFHSCFIFIDDKQCIVKIKQLTPVQNQNEQFFNCSNLNLMDHNLLKTLQKHAHAIFCDFSQL